MCPGWTCHTRSTERPPSPSTAPGRRFALEVVRVQAKQEPPLRNLRGGGGAVAISAIADVEFYGRDMVGHEVSAAGALSVVFADWADPK